jgi:hypothetical protein
MLDAETQERPRARNRIKETANNPSGHADVEAETLVVPLGHVTNRALETKFVEHAM